MIEQGRRDFSDTEAAYRQALAVFARLGEARLEGIARRALESL